MHAHWQLKQHALLCLRFFGGPPLGLGGPPLGASMGFPHRGVRAGWAAWTNSLLDLVQPLGENLGRWLDSPVLHRLLPQVGAIPNGIGWRMRRGIGGMQSVSLLARHAIRTGGCRRIQVLVLLVGSAHTQMETDFILRGLLG